MSTTTQFLESAETLDMSKLGITQLQNGYVCQLSDQSLIQARGDDAASFLHNQLSNDVEHLNDTQSRYAAYCTPKGRMLASFLYWKMDGNIVLQCSASLQPALQKRLQMFVMRSKVKLSEVSEQFAILGLGGKAAEAFLLTQFDQLPSAINDKVSSDDAGTLVRLHDAFDTARYQWVVAQEKLTAISANMNVSLLKVDASIWRLGNIHAGLPQVVELSKEKFVPQMINFELIGGVNFRKGCYPGQEIVARSQYLGKLKRRMAIATVKTDVVDVAMEIFSDNDPSQPCGMIVSAERNFGEGFACLVEIKLADQEQGKVHLGASDGPILEFLPLPYAYLDVTE
ncbi:CAF17-like 4Fe-4S cluster assembly/insertion protein YgfZ [Undibacterium flavidum]|uniref:Folate-binding protein YgfZ n=1 Tax=Undibacterium flavidum TaxID=2762297 RepID=A0ABR6YFV1_9BURK|nr:folate-binding protein YgfZ [Undibacterium flavidum]MBC3875440.1 folate-binding protein YgfZ [Undibacterium flavidum]